MKPQNYLPGHKPPEPDLILPEDVGEQDSVDDIPEGARP